MTDPPGGQPRLSATEIAIRKRYKLPMTATDDEVNEKMNQVQVETVLNGVHDFIEKHIDLDPQHLDAIVLWAVGTHIHLNFRYYPYLLVSSPSHGSGKSTLFDALVPVVFNGFHISGITAPAIREQSKGNTLLLDEIDSDPKGFKELKQVLNAGFQQGQPHVNKKMTYDTYGPKGLAGNEPTGLSPATESRCLPIYMLRSKPGAVKARLSVTPENWTKRVAATCGDAVVPQIDRLIALALGTMAKHNIENRTNDLWLPLFVWAHAAGPAWVDRVLAAFRKVEEIRPKSVQAGVIVLDVLRDVFAAHGDRVPSTVLVAALNAHDDVKDARLKIDPIRLASLLRPFHIQRQLLWIGGKPIRGYEKADFIDAWARYCS